MVTHRDDLRAVTWGLYGNHVRVAFQRDGRWWNHMRVAFQYDGRW